MKSQIAILTACCLLGGCVDDWFDSGSVGVDRGANQEDSSLLGAAKAPLIEQAEYIASIQTEAETPQANLTGTWILLGVEIAESAFVFGETEFPYNARRSEVSTIFITQNGNEISLRNCVDDASETYVLSENNSISPALFGYDQLSITDNRVIIFNNRFSTYENERIDEETGFPYTDKGQTGTYAQMIKLDVQVGVPMATLAQNDMEIELDCVDAFKEVTEEIQENNVFLDHRFEAIDIEGNAYVGEGRNTRDGGVIEGDAEYTYAENQFQVILNGLFSTVSITD